GVLMGAWPDFRCTGREVIGAFAAALLLFAVLLGLHSLRTSLHPAPTPRPETQQMRRVAKEDLRTPTTRGLRHDAALCHCFKKVLGGEVSFLSAECAVLRNGTGRSSF